MILVLWYWCRCKCNTRNICNIYITSSLQNISAKACIFVLNERHSKKGLSCRTTKSFGYENLLTVAIPVLSIFISNWLQKINQSKYVQSNILIISVRSIAFFEFLHFFLLLFPAFLSKWQQNLRDKLDVRVPPGNQIPFVQTKKCSIFPFLNYLNHLKGMNPAFTIRMDLIRNFPSRS